MAAYANANWQLLPESDDDEEGPHPAKSWVLTKLPDMSRQWRYVWSCYLQASVIHANEAPLASKIHYSSTCLENCGMPSTQLLSDTKNDGISVTVETVDCATVMAIQKKLSGIGHRGTVAVPKRNGTPSRFS